MCDYPGGPMKLLGATFQGSGKWPGPTRVAVKDVTPK